MGCILGELLLNRPLMPGESVKGTCGGRGREKARTSRKDGGLEGVSNGGEAARGAVAGGREEAGRFERQESAFDRCICARGEARVGGLGAIWRVHMWGALMVGG